MANEIKKLNINQERTVNYESLGQLRILDSAQPTGMNGNASGIVAARMAFGEYKMPNIQPEQPSAVNRLQKEDR